MTALPRKVPTLRVKLAAALCALTDRDGERMIEHEHAKAMSAEQVISLFQFHHFPIRHEAGGPAEHWNLDPVMIVPHRERTAKIDVPEAAKVKRVVRTQSLHQSRMDAKATGDAAPEVRRRGPKLQSRGFSKQNRPLRSGNDLRRQKT